MPTTPMSPAPPMDPFPRLLCGPGPTNVEPSVLAAMQEPIMSHLDYVLHDRLLGLIEMLTAIYGANEGVALPLQSTGMSGMEMGIVSLVEPGDTVIVAQAGFFAKRIVQMAERHGANVVELSAEWGNIVPIERVLEALDQHPEARVVAAVHAETSTGAAYPLKELAAAVRDRDAFLLADCVTSLGAMPVAIDDWGIDFAYSCTQKALGAPPGMSPVAFSARALERTRTATGRTLPFSFDVDLLIDYWVKRPAAYHHTAPVLHIYALYEALRHAANEGLEARWARHEAAGRHLQEKVIERGFDLLAPAECRLAHVTCVRVPDHIDGPRVQRRLLDEHNIEVGGGLGPAAPPMWRIGLMGPNANIETANHVLAALDSVLATEPSLAAQG